MRIRALCLSVVAALAAAAILSGQTRSTDPILIGMSAAFSGPSRGLGIELYRGSQAYFNEVNAAGGINGRPIQIKAYDDGYNPEPAILNTIKLIEQDRVLALFNYVGASTTTRVMPLLKRFSDRQTYFFFPFTGTQILRLPPYEEYVFNLRASYRDETYGLVDRFASVGRKKIAILYQSDAYGRSGWEGVRVALNDHKLPAAAEATYFPNTPYTTSMSAQVAILKRAEPDAIIVIGSYAASAAFIRDAVNTGWDVPIANISNVGCESMVGLLVAEGKRTGKDYTSRLVNSHVVPSYDDTTLPAVNEYRIAMITPPDPPAVADLKEYEPLGYNFAGFEGYLNAKLLVEVLRRLGAGGELNPAYIRTVVEAIKEFDLGIDEPISFAGDRHQALQSVFYSRVEDGQLVAFTDWSALAK